MGLAVSYHSVKAETRFDSRPVRIGFVVYKVAQGQVSLSSLPLALISPTHMQSHQLRTQVYFN